MSKETKNSFLNLTAVERHRCLLGYHESCTNHNSSAEAPLTSTSSKYGFFSKEEEEEISHAHKFIREEGDEDSSWDKWATRLAKKYYHRLCKEYCIVDLSLYEYGCLGTRWRTKEEVLEGKGQFICASKQCQETEFLHTYEVNFSYSEEGVKKQALVKVRLCPSCMTKMNFKRTILKEKVEKALQKCSKRKQIQQSSRKKKKSKAHEQTSETLKDVYLDDSEAMEDCLEDLLL